MKNKTPYHRQIIFFSLVLFSVMTFFVITFVQGSDVIEAVGHMVTGAKEKVVSVTAPELATMMERGDDIIVLDIRTEAEYAAGHLNGAVWIPRGKLEFIAEGKLSSTDQEIIVYCRVDSRAAQAAETLEEIGFKNVRYLEGGFADWAREGRSIFNRHGELTVKAFERQENK